MQHQICSQKQALVEKLGIFIETRDHLAPVAARILSYIILTGKKGTTFEDLVTILCASKSTISTHLNHLYELNRVKYFTKVGDRKKYYTINQEIILQGMDRMLSNWQAEKELHQEIKAYKEAVNSHMVDDSEKFELKFHDNFLNFLNEAIKLISTLKTQIQQKQ